MRRMEQNNIIGSLTCCLNLLTLSSQSEESWLTGKVVIKWRELIWCKVHEPMGCTNPSVRMTNQQSPYVKAWSWKGLYWVGFSCAPQKVLNACFKLSFICPILWVRNKPFICSLHTVFKCQGSRDTCVVAPLSNQTSSLARPVVRAHCLYPPSAFAKVLIIHPSYMFKAGGWHLWDYCTDHPGARESCVGVSGAAAITLLLAHREIHLRFWALPLNRVTLCCSGSIFIRQRTDWQQLNTRQYLWVGWRTSK